MDTATIAEIRHPSFIKQVMEQCGKCPLGVNCRKTTCFLHHDIPDDRMLETGWMVIDGHLVVQVRIIN